MRNNWIVRHRLRDLDQMAAFVQKVGYTPSFRVEEDGWRATQMEVLNSDWKWLISAYYKCGWRVIYPYVGRYSLARGIAELPKFATDPFWLHLEAYIQSSRRAQGLDK